MFSNVVGLAVGRAGQSFSFSYVFLFLEYCFVLSSYFATTFNVLDVTLFAQVPD